MPAFAHAPQATGLDHVLTAPAANLVQQILKQDPALMTQMLLGPVVSSELLPTLLGHIEKGEYDKLDGAVDDYRYNKSPIVEEALYQYASSLHKTAVEIKTGISHKDLEDALKAWDQHQTPVPLDTFCSKQTVLLDPATEKNPNVLTTNLSALTPLKDKMKALVDGRDSVKKDLTTAHDKTKADLKTLQEYQQDQTDLAAYKGGREYRAVEHLLKGADLKNVKHADVTASLQKCTCKSEAEAICKAYNDGAQNPVSPTDSSFPTQQLAALNEALQNAGAQAIKLVDLLTQQVALQAAEQSLQQGIATADQTKQSYLDRHQAVVKELADVQKAIDASKQMLMTEDKLESILSKLTHPDSDLLKSTPSEEGRTTLEACGIKSGGNVIMAQLAIELQSPQLHPSVKKVLCDGVVKELANQPTGTPPTDAQLEKMVLQQLLIHGRDSKGEVKDLSLDMSTASTPQTPQTQTPQVQPTQGQTQQKHQPQQKTTPTDSDQQITARVDKGQAYVKDHPQGEGNFWDVSEAASEMGTKLKLGQTKTVEMVLDCQDWAAANTKDGKTDGKIIHESTGIFPINGGKHLLLIAMQKSTDKHNVLQLPQNAKDTSNMSAALAKNSGTYTLSDMLAEVQSPEHQQAVQVANRADIFKFGSSAIAAPDSSKPAPAVKAVDPALEKHLDLLAFS